MDADYAEIVSALRALPGVAAADLEADREGGGLGVLRLALSPGADEVRVAGDVGRILQERFGIGVDADRLQIIEDSAVPAPLEGGSRRRAVVERLRVSTTGLEVSVAVTLALAGQRVTGEATAAATPAAAHRAAAAAGLRAMEQLADQPVRFELDDVRITGSGRDRVAVAVVTMLSAAGADRLTGAAVVRDDTRQACLRAALDAVNRRVEPWLPG